MLTMWIVALTNTKVSKMLQVLVFTLLQFCGGPNKLGFVYIVIGNPIWASLEISIRSI